MRLRKWQVRMKWYDGDEIYGPYFFRSNAEGQARVLNAPFYLNAHAFVERIED